MEQEYTSKNTCIRTINMVYKRYSFLHGSVILDYGAGKYDDNKNYMARMGCHVLAYDKYNRSDAHNAEVMEKAAKKCPDYVVCSNVLNVIKEESVIHEILNELAGFAERGAKILITVYEGNRSGTGAATTKGWQRNQKLSWYMKAAMEYMETRRLAGGILSCASKE